MKDYLPNGLTMGFLSSEAKHKVQILYVNKLYVDLLNCSDRQKDNLVEIIVSIRQALNRIKEESLEYSHKVTDPVAKKRAVSCGVVFYFKDEKQNKRLMNKRKYVIVYCCVSHFGQAQDSVRHLMRFLSPE